MKVPLSRTHYMVSVRVAAILLAVMIAPGTLFAQSVSGVLVDEETGVPVGRAYVVLLGGDSVEVTRGFADGLGRFRIRAPRPGTYRLRTERIGFRSSLSEPFELVEGRDLELEVPVRPVLVKLAPLTVEGGGECRVIGNQALEVLTVWEETRKALSAVAWLDPFDQLIHEMDHFERWYTKSFKLVHEARATQPTHNVMPFRSRSVEELEEFGYVVIEEDSILYEAPDAQVFFSEPFLQNHCFRLDQKRGDGRHKLGLRFEPVEGRDIADVRGVFWLDAATGALENLELEYVNVGVWQREQGASAELEFDRLPDGRWFVSRWWIRMPVVRRVESMTGAIWHFPEAVVGFYEEGGEVLRVFSVDGRTLFARGRASLTGVVYDSSAGTVLADAYVHLEGTERATYSSADGSYWLTDLPQGRYNVTFSHPRTVLFGLREPPDEKEVRLRDGAVLTANLALPPADSIAARLCPADTNGELGLLVGRVRGDPTDSAIVGARVNIIWMIPGAASPGTRSLETSTDSLGIYRACIPRRAAISIEVKGDSMPMKAVSTTFGEKALRVADIRMVRPDSSHH